MTCFFFSTAADWADTFSAAAVWAALAAEVAPAAVAARAVQPVAAAAAAAQRAEAAQAVQPAEASAAAGRPWGVVEVARPAPGGGGGGARFNSACGGGVGRDGVVAPGVGGPRLSRSCTFGGVVGFWTTGGLPGAPGAALSFWKFGRPVAPGGGSLVLVLAPGVGGGGGAPQAPGTGSALVFGSSSRNGAAPGLTLAGVTPGARGLIAALGGAGSLPCWISEARCAVEFGRASPERGTASTGRRDGGGRWRGIVDHRFDDGGVVDVVEDDVAGRRPHIGRRPDKGRERHKRRPR